MDNKRILKFYYFKPYLFKNGNKKKPFNFAEWIINFEKNDNIFKTIVLNSMTARIDGHSYDKINDLHGVCFVNMRNENLPSKVTEGKAQEDLELDDDDYIGEDMYVLYDRSTNIFMMQSNRMSLSINRITEFINIFKTQDSLKVGFIPIIKNISKKYLKTKKIRCISASCEANYDKSNMQSTALKSICDSFSSIGCLTYNFKLSVGRKRNAELSPEESQKMIDDILNRNIIVNSAKASILDDTTGELEYVDLIHNKLCSQIEYNVKKRERLHLEPLFKKMTEEYLKVKTNNFL